MIGGVIKYFRFSFDYVLWDISFLNLSMLLATIPKYESETKPGQSDNEKVEHVESMASLAEFLKS